MSEQKEFYFFNNLVKQRLNDIANLKINDYKEVLSIVLKQEPELAGAYIYLFWLQRECFTPSYTFRNIFPLEVDDRIRYMQFFSFTVLAISKAPNWQDGPDKDWKDQLLGFMVGHLKTLSWIEIEEQLLIDIYSLFYLKHLDKIKQ